MTPETTPAEVAAIAARSRQIAQYLHEIKWSDNYAHYVEAHAPLMRLLEQHAPTDIAWLLDALRASEAARVRAETENARLDALLNTPEIHDFGKAVVLEAAHQREHKDDSWKTDADWYWLIGYLAGKAMWNPCEPEDNATEKRLHRVITVAAAAANWHADIARRALAHEEARQ